MLLIVINDEQPEEQQAAQDATGRLGPQVEIPVCPGQRDEDAAHRDVVAQPAARVLRSRYHFDMPATFLEASAHRSARLSSHID